MSYANGTTHYNLPQTLGTDKRDWFDTNQAFADIDAALYAAATGQVADAEAIVEINQHLVSNDEDIAALQRTTSSHTAQIEALSRATSQNTSDIGDLRSDAEDMITAYNEGSAATSTRAYAIGDYFIYNDVLYRATAAIAIGDTIVPNTNCEATNVTTEISKLNSDLAASYVFKSTRSVTLATADGTKTIGQLLSEANIALKALTPLYTHSKIANFVVPVGNGTNAQQTFLLETFVDLFSDFSGRNLVGFNVATSSGTSVSLYYLNAGAQTPFMTLASISANTTVSDISSRVPASGTKLNIMLEEYIRG